MMEQRLSVVTLGVRDLAASRGFYERLGWKAANDEAEGVVFFQLNGMVLALFPREELAKDAALPAEGSGFGGITLAYNARSEEEVDAVLTRAQTAGGRILKPAGETFWGGYSGYFADLDGHPWETAWNPHWTVTDEGNVLIG